MTEIFTDIPQTIKDLAKNWVDLALRQRNLYDGVKMIAEFANSCNTEEEKEFVDFYFKLRLEQMANEDNSNIS